MEQSPSGEANSLSDCRES